MNDNGGWVLGMGRLRAGGQSGQDFFAGTFLPALRAFESPMAIACLGFVTFLPLRPDFSLPFFISLISVSTLLPAAGEYFRPEDFFADDFRVEDFFADALFLLVLFRAEVVLRALLFFTEERVLRVLLFLVAELLFRVLPDLFFAAFFVAIDILLENQMLVRFESVVWHV